MLESCCVMDGVIPAVMLRRGDRAIGNLQCNVMSHSREAQLSHMIKSVLFFIAAEGDLMYHQLPGVDG